LEFALRLDEPDDGAAEVGEHGDDAVGPDGGLENPFPAPWQPPKEAR